MKKLFVLYAAVLCLFTAVSCNPEENNPDQPAAKTTRISIVLPTTKAVLGDKVGDYWPNYWKEGDIVSVNGVASEALKADAAGKASADFSFAGTIATPYCAASPASAVSDYKSGSATLTVPATQKYVAGSYDPDAFLLYGKSNLEGRLSLTPCVSIFHLSVKGTASVSRVSLIAEEGSALSGSYTTDFQSLAPATVSNEVELVSSSPVALPADFYICVPAGVAAGQVIAKVYDSADGFMAFAVDLKEDLKAGTMYSHDELTYEATSLKITAEGITSSTAVICWNDPACPYTVGVYPDESCNSPVEQYVISKGNECWEGEDPRFCLSGLAPGSTYFVKVQNDSLDIVSNILPVTTAAFDIVQVSETPAAVGDVILAEDFGELRWDSELIGRGVGFFPTSQDSFANHEVDTYLPIDTNSEKTLGSQGDALSKSRLGHWAQGANNNLYIHPGYIKLVGSKKVTHLVTPALDNIPEGKLATLEVKVTASAYYSESSASYATTSAIVAVQPAGSYNELTSEESKTNTLDLTGNIAPFTLTEETAWNEYTVTLSKVGKGDRLAFGAASNVTENNARMNISDIKVTVKALEEPSLEASLKSVSSSTAAFAWTYGGSPAADIAKPYKFALYGNAACTDLVVSFESSADAERWDGKSPCFVFGGLKPATDYWFVATDTEANVSSDPVKATTEAFTVVEPDNVVNPQVGDVILAEDFSEVSHGPDELAVAAGYVTADHKLLTAPSGEIHGDDNFVSYANTGNRLFGSGWDISGSRMDTGWGFAGNSAVYTRNGYLRVATSTGRTHIVTPLLSCLPAGQQVTIEVSVTACKYENNENDVAVFVNRNLEMSTKTDPSDAGFKKYPDASLSGGYALGITSVKEWETKSVTISDVDPDCQLVIGSLEDISGKNRFYLNDVTVKITAIAETPGFKIKDEESFLSFVNQVATDKTLEASVTQNITVSAAAAEAFSSIEDYAGTLNGNGRTISGLTKPLFNELKGTANRVILNSTINVTSDQVDLGMLANVLSGTANGCISRGSVTFEVEGGVSEEHRIGGLIGKAEASGATITDCTNEAIVINKTASADGNGGELIIGGVLGCFWGTQFSISGCKNTGAVTNNAYWNKAISVGGIIGQAGNGASGSCNMIVSDCTNSGAIANNGNTDSSNNVGGIIGWIRHGTYDGNTNTGAIFNSGEAPNNYIGGLFGYLDINAKFKNNSNSGAVSNSGEATSANVIGGIVGYIGKNNVISDAGDSAKYKLTNSGDIENSGSAKNVFMGGLFGRNSSGYFNMTGISTVYSSNSGTLTDTSGPAKSNGGDICIGGIAGYTTTGIKTQYARNTGNIAVHGDKGNTSVNAGGIGGWISNAAFNFNNCRNYGNITVDCTTTASLWVAGIVGCPKNNKTTHYYWYSKATIDTHAATVGGDNFTAGLMAVPEGSYDSSQNKFIMYGHKLSGTVWGSKTTTGLFCCTKNSAFTFSLQGGESHPNTIAPGTVRKDDTHDDTINSIEDVTTGVLAGGVGSDYDISSAGDNLAVAEW